MLLQALLITPAMPVSLEKRLYGKSSGARNGAWRMRRGRRRALRETNNDALRAVGSCKCFVAGTLVKVHPDTVNSRQIKGESYKEIDKLQIGDLVLSANEHTGELSYRPVTELFVHDVKLIHRLTYKEGLTIETTWNHPFWVQDQGWTEAKDLHAGERSVTARSILKGKQPRLQTVSFTSKVQPGFDDPSMLTWDDAREGTLSVARVEEVHRADKVYNIEVEGNHTYFVTEEGVLVHNYVRPNNSYDPSITSVDLAETSGFVGTFRGIGQRFGNFFQGYGFDTDAENLLEYIASGDKTSKTLSLKMADGSTITRYAGSSGVSLNLKGEPGDPNLTGRTINLRGTADFQRLMDGGSGWFGGFGNISTSDSGMGWLNENIQSYYGTGAVSYGGSAFSFDNTEQGTRSDGEILRPNGSPYTFPSKQWMAAHGIPSWTGYGNLKNEVSCYYAGQVNLLKANGLLPPDATVYDVEKSQYAAGWGVSGGVPNQNMIAYAGSSDWAKLMGKSGSYSLASVPAGVADAYMNSGGTALVTNGDHFWTLTGPNRTVNDPWHTNALERAVVSIFNKKPLTRQYVLKRNY